MKVIGLVGYPRSGKDAAAGQLVAHHGYHRIAFGDGVKSLLMATDPYYQDDLAYLERCKAEGLNNTRERLQNLGQTLRDFDPDFWVKTAMKKIKSLPDDSKVIITDIRYQNEFHLVKDLGGEIVGVTRPGYGAVNDHVSEQNTATLLEHADRTVINDDTIQFLTRCILGDYKVHG
jgi:hypothetical protein